MLPYTAPTIIKRSAHWSVDLLPSRNNMFADPYLTHFGTKHYDGASATLLQLQELASPQWIAFEAVLFNDTGRLITYRDPRFNVEEAVVRAARLGDHFTRSYNRWCRRETSEDCRAHGWLGTNLTRLATGLRQGIGIDVYPRMPSELLEQDPKTVLEKYQGKTQV